MNGFESNITGVDIAVHSDFEVGPGSLGVDVRANFNDQEVKNVVSGTLNASTVYDLENQVPSERAIITLDYKTDTLFSGYARLNYFGGWGDSGGQLAAGDASEAVSYGSKTLVDIEATFHLNDIFGVSVGGENIFDTLPDDDGHFVAQLLGVDKALTSPFGVNGAFWYVRLTADF